MRILDGNRRQADGLVRQEGTVSDEVAWGCEAHNGFAARSTVAGEFKVTVLHTVDSAHILAFGKELFTFFDVAVALEGTKGLNLLAVKQSEGRFLPGGAGGAEGFHGDRDWVSIEVKVALLSYEKSDISHGF